MNVPKLRFSEFNDEWKKEELGKYLIQYKEITKVNNQYPVLTSSRQGLFFQEDYFNRQVASKDNTGYNIVPRNYFTYRHMSDDTIFSFNINTLCDYGIVSTLYPVFKTNENLDSYFLKMYLNNGKRFSEYCLLQKQGGSRTYMYFDKLKKFKALIPSIKEQEKIGNMLSLLDKKIELQSKKIEDLKLYKICIIKSLFKRNNLNKVKIKDICTCNSSSLNMENLENIDGDYNVYGATGLIKKINTYQFENESLAIIKDGASVGKTIICTEKSSILGTLNALSSKIYSPYYLEMIMSNINFNKYIVGSGIPHIYYKDYSNEQVLVHDEDEAKMISLFYKDMLFKISLENKKLIELIKMKNGLMQNMFV